MMDDLISRAAAKFQACNWSVKPDAVIYDVIKKAIKSKLDMAPAVDAAPVIRCRDCKHYDRRCFTCENDVLLIKIDDCGCHPPFRVDDDWFCADGERRDENGTVAQ